MRGARLYPGANPMPSWMMRFDRPLREKSRMPADGLYGDISRRGQGWVRVVLVSHASRHRYDHDAAFAYWFSEGEYRTFGETARAFGVSETAILKAAYS